MRMGLLAVPTCGKDPAIRTPAQGSDRHIRSRKPQAMPVKAVNGELPVIEHKGQHIHRGAPAAQCDSSRQGFV